MTRYYFASRYSNNSYLRNCRDELIRLIPDSIVTSRWIDCHPDIVGGLEQSFTPEALACDPRACWRFGEHDLNDLVDAHVIVSFTGSGGKGGRHVEHGFALALNKRIVVVGPRENIFHCHPKTEVYPDWTSFLGTELVTTLE